MRAVVKTEPVTIRRNHRFNREGVMVGFTMSSEYIHTLDCGHRATRPTECRRLKCKECK
jgi:hypothetical protein